MMRNEAFTKKIETHKLKTIAGLAAAALGLTALGGIAEATTPEPTTPTATTITAQATTPAADTAPAPAPAPSAAPAVEAQPTPVAGLDQTQMNNAKHITDAAKDMGLGEDAQTIAVATAMQESNLYNLASTKIPESYQYSNGQGEGSDHDSVGLFQQRPNWGSTQELMDPQTSARLFLEALIQVDGWQNMPLTRAAQAVQVSAYPDHYAKHETKATTVVDTLNK